MILLLAGAGVGSVKSSASGSDSSRSGESSASDTDSSESPIDSSAGSVMNPQQQPPFQQKNAAAAYARMHVNILDQLCCNFYSFRNYRNYRILIGECRIIRGAEFLEDIRYAAMQLYSFSM